MPGSVARLSHTCSNGILGGFALDHTFFDVTTFDWIIQANTVCMTGVLAEATQSVKWTINSDTSRNPYQPGHRPRSDM